jgi:hypothetical protein
LAAYSDEGKVVAWGRTSSRPDIVSSVKSWLESVEIEVMHERYLFVDHQRRQLDELHREIFELQASLFSASVENRPKGCDLHELWIREQDRSCRIYYYGKNKYPNTEFHWDGCELFAFVADDIHQLAQVLARWISGRAMPSALRKEFPWIQLRRAAQYYEEGRGIEGEFVESWDRIEQFYEEMKFEPGTAVRAFVAELRRKGYDSVLRAGQSMYTLMLSRSRRHGLRRGQGHVAFQFRQTGMDVVSRIGEEKTISRDLIGLDDEIAAVLELLAQAPVE